MVITITNLNASTVLFIHVCTSLCFITAVVYLDGQRWQMIKISKGSATSTHTHKHTHFPFSPSPSLYLLIYLSISNAFIPPMVSSSFCVCFFITFSLSPFLPSLLHPPFLHRFIHLSHIFIATSLAPLYSVPPWETTEAITRAARGSVCVTCAGLCVCVCARYNCWYEICPPTKPLMPRL